MALAALFVLSSIALGSPHVAASAAPSGDRTAPVALGSSLISGAEHSLALGLGPANGAPMHCMASGSVSSRCSPNSAPLPTALPAGTTVGSAEWQDLSPNQVTGPGSQQEAMMAYFPTLNAIVLIGGSGTSGTLHTWIFKGGLWSDVTASVTGAPSARWAGGLVYDAADGYLLLFGGRSSSSWLNDTWTFNGTTWTNLGLSYAPAERAYFTMVYDPTDSYVVVFSGGCYCGTSGSRLVYNDTWTFHAGAWTNLSSSLSAAPPALTFFPGAWDAHDGYLLVFGGNVYGSCGGANLTWTFVAGAWTNRTAGSNGPPTLGGNDALAYDPTAGVVVFFGGVVAGCSPSASTWLYQGGAWSDASAYLGGSAPPASSLGPLAWDAGDGYLLLYGGQSSFGTLSSTYALRLNSSLLVSATASPSGGPAPMTVHFFVSVTGGRSPYTFTWDPGDGSANSSGPYFNHTYAKSGVYTASVLVNDSSTNSSDVGLQIVVTSDSWYNLPSSAVQPPWLEAAAMTYDPQINGILLFGGVERSYPYSESDQTWEYVGGVWQNISTALATSPSARYGASLVFDVNDSYALLFGGNSIGCPNLCNDTWTFTPSSGWTLLSPTISPPARFEFAMADDPNDGYVVLFGGESSSTYYYYYYFIQLADTWTFHAGQWTNWTSRTTTSPGAIIATSATFDTAAGEVVMFGGADGCRTTGQTWTFAGGNWTQDTTGSQPPDDLDGSVAYDPVLHAVVLFGGLAYVGSRCTYTLYNETWTFANGAWNDSTSITNGAPPQDELTAMSYDEAAGAIVYVGDLGDYYGYYGYGYFQPVWTWPGAPLVTTTSVTPSEGIVPFNVTFTASTSGGVGPYNDSWDFGDGSPNDTGSSVTHDFTRAENYTVTLTSNDSGGRASITYLSVVGFGSLLSVPSSTSTLGQVPWPVHFYSNATGGVPPLSRSWSFGDGATSTAASPLHTYTTAGNYTAKLSLRDASGSTENWSFSIEAVPKLVAAPTDSPSVGQTPLTVNFTAGDVGGLGPFAFNWSFGDSSANVTVADPSHTYSSAGVYLAQLEVTDTLHDEARASLSVTVTVPLVALPTATPTEGLAPLAVTFVDASTGGSLPYTISWNFGDGSSPAVGGIVAYTYSTPGNFTATESVTDAVGIVSQESIVITVVRPLAASLTENTTLAVAPASVSFAVHPMNGVAPFVYSFRFGDGGTAAGTSVVNHTFLTTGTFEVRATVTDSAHEAATADVNVTVVAPLIARLSASPQTLYVGATLNLSAGSAGGVGPYAYTWTGLPTGCASSAGSTVSCQPTQAKNYTISVTVGDRSGQNSTASAWVLVSAASTGSGGAGSGSTLPGGSLLWILLVIVVVAVVAIALVLVRRRRGPSSEPDPPEEPVGESYDASVDEPGPPDGP